MLKILNSDGRQIELSKNQVITTDKINPLFNDPDKLVQDISYKFNAPFSENNKLFFGLGHLIESSNSSFVLHNIRFYNEESLMITGNIRYRVGTSAFECNLEPNLTALNYNLKNVNLNDIRTQDSDFNIANTDAKFKALMLDTCKFPEKYNYIFFPLQNSDKFVNNYSVPDQAFTGITYNTPYFKLTYILKVIAGYLDLTPVGDFFENKKNNSVYNFCPITFSSGLIYPSMRYMPKMLIVDFLKQIRERLHIAFDFNLSNQTLTVKSFRDIYDSSNSVDITQYVFGDIEQELPEEQGFQVTLKSDETDQEFAVTSGDETTYPPVYTLFMGAATTPVVLDCSTTRFKEEPNGFIHPIVSQAIYGPQTMGEINNQWPVRLIRYLGYNEHAPGVFTPDAKSMDLDDDDLFYYRFQNDSKRIILSALFPPSILARLNLTDKFCFRSSGLNYVNLIIEKISYDSSANNELIPTKITARTMNFDVLTAGSVVYNTAHDTVEQSGRLVSYISAYFDKAIHGFSSLKVDIVTTTPGSGRTYTVDTITAPTNNKGANGQVYGIYKTAGVGLDDYVELRVYVGKPKFVELLGQRTPFTFNGTYYTANIIPARTTLFDWHWISF